jgi:hypothetical protein
MGQLGLQEAQARLARELLELLAQLVLLEFKAQRGQLEFKEFLEILDQQAQLE